MTTTVKISAHCAGNKEVKVSIRDNVTGDSYEEFSLQDGETAERVVYADREISVMEAIKA